MTRAPDDVLDCLGLVCPVPIGRLSERISLLPPGSVLEVISDDPDFARDVAAYCRTTGAECLGVSSNESRTHAFVRRPVNPEAGAGHAD